MSISITLTPAEERKLADLARSRGSDPAEIARDVVAAYLSVASEAPDRSIEEILAPIWQGWAKSGLDHAEVEDLLDRELHDARGERRRAGRMTP